MVDVIHAGEGGGEGWSMEMELGLAPMKEF